MTDPSSVFDRFQAALEAGDADAAGDAALAVERVQAAPADLLAELDAAIREGRADRGRLVAASLRRRYDERVTAETTGLLRSELGRTRVDNRSTAFRTLTEHGLRLAAARTERAGTLVEAAGFLRGTARSPGRREALLARVSRLDARESTLGAAVTAAAEITDPMDLPARVTVTGGGLTDDTLPVGRAARTELRLANAGDGPAEGVELRFDPPDGLGVSPRTLTPGRIEPRSTVTRTVSVTARAPGTYELQGRLSADSGPGDTVLLDVTAESPPASPVAALDRNGNGLLDTEEVQRAIAAWQDDEPLTALDDRPPTAEEVRRAVAAWADSRFV